MSNVIFYNGIGIFDPSGTLIAQGTQQVKFTGAVTVSVIADQTVVDVTGGGSVSGDPNTLAFFNNSGVLTDLTTARFLTTRTLAFHATLLPFPANVVFSDSLVFGTMRNGGSSAVVGATVTNLICNGNNTSVLSQSLSALNNCAVFGTSNTFTVRRGWNSCLFSGSNNSVSSPVGTTVSNLVIIGKSNSYAPSAIGSGPNVIIGSSNSLDRAAYAESKIFGSANSVSIIDTGVVGNGNHLVVGDNNTLSAGSRGMSNIMTFGFLNVTANLSASAASSYLHSYGSGNTINASGNSELYNFGSANAIICNGNGLNNAFNSGLNNTINIAGAGAASGVVSIVGQSNLFIADKLTNFNVFGSSNSLNNNALASATVIVSGVNNQLQGSGFLDKVSIFGSNNICSGGLNAENFIMVGRGLQNSLSSNEILFGTYNDTSDTSLQMAFAVGTSVTPVNAFGVKANNKSVDLKITNFRPVSLGLAPANTLSIDASVIELTASLTIDEFSAGVNPGQIVVVRQSSAGSSVISQNTTIVLPSGAPITLTEDSSATFIWSGLKNKWTLVSLVLY